MAVEVGEEAPDFELPDQHGTPVKLSSFRGAKNVVLVFYPLAFSPVCSGELCALREDFPEVDRDDVELLTVSVDHMFAHRAWARQALHACRASSRGRGAAPSCRILS